MQERFKEEKAKQAAAKRAPKATAETSAPGQPLGTASSPSKPPYSSSLGVEKELESSSNYPHVKSLFISAKGVQKAVKAGMPLVLLTFKSSATNDCLPSDVQPLLDEFKDVFPEEIPGGLPPVRGIEHQIDFIPGAVLPN